MTESQLLLPVLRGALAHKNIGPKIIANNNINTQCDLKISLNVSNRTLQETAVQIFQDIKNYQAQNSNPLSSIAIGDKKFSVFWSYKEIDLGMDFSVLEKLEKQGPLGGKIALVTGGAQGFGEGIVRYLIEKGAFVFIADLNIGKAKKLASELNNNHEQLLATALGVDVSNESSVMELAKKVIETWGGLDLFISNAGVLKAASVKTMDFDDFEFVTRVNYLGYFLGVKHFSPIMAAQNYANNNYYSDIIQINSKSGLAGSNKNAAYAGGKFGGIGLTQSFALELVSDNIKVNAICPGNFFEGPLWSDPEKGLFAQYLEQGKVPGAATIADVKQFYENKVPMKRGCIPEDVCRAILYCIEQKYETGQAVPVTGGQIMLS